MKKISICLFAAAALLGIGCDDKVPEPGTLDVPVQSVTLDESLSNGVTLEVGQTLDAALKVHVEPYNATDLAETFYSSNVEVATVSAKGVVTAQKPGITMISIYVGGFEVYFTVTVVDQIPVDIESISFTSQTMEACIGVGYTLYVTTEPLDQNEGVVFSSSDPTIATIDPESGYMQCLQIGTVTITASAKNHPEIFATMEVTVTEFYGDYDRSNWKMTFSHEVYPDANLLSTETAAIDGDLNSVLMMVRPGKQWGSSYVIKVPSNEEIWFMVDMGTANPVNYFRIHHRENPTSNPVRWHGFSRIEGSNDGTEFTLIASNVVVPNADDETEISPDIDFGQEVSYRYLRFVGGTDSFCYGSKGSTVQMKEFYLGRKK